MKHVADHARDPGGLVHLRGRGDEFGMGVHAGSFTCGVAPGGGVRSGGIARSLRRNAARRTPEWPTRKERLRIVRELPDPHESATPNSVQ